jgi:hypothetical protein
MLDNFWTSMGSKLAERWLEYLFGPAFLFWATGFVVYTWKTGWQTLSQDIQGATPFQQGFWLLLALFILAFSSVLMQALRFPILRLLEGYWPWPLRYLRLGIVAMRQQDYQKIMADLRRLASEEPKKLDPAQRDRLIELELWAHWQPANVKDLLPTDFGNIMRARERSPERFYSLDAIICWPRLWLLLPETTRTDLTNTRATLDRLAEFWFWGLLSLLWAIWLPWTGIISLLWMFVAYRMACQAAMAYGELLEAAFNLHRFLLYDALGWPRPQNTQEEHALGAQLTEYLWRGTLPAPVTYPTKEM